MGNKAKKIISLVAAATMASSILALAACNAKPNSLDNPLSYTSSQNAAKSNGGFAVEKDGYVYFINGQALSTASNEYGKVEKASLLRISTADLKNGAYDKTETVVPLLFVSGNVNSGIYIYGDYVYFATPTTEKDLDGNVLSGSLDFKRAKLDGTEVMSDYYFRTKTNSIQYRYVKGDDGKVYCMYVDENNALKSYDIEARTETVLVKGAVGNTFLFNKDQDGENSDVVYYAMNVPGQFFGTENAENEKYTQIYRVSATAKVTNVDNEKASYTFKDGDKYEKTYDFNEEYFKEVIAEEKAAAKEEKKKEKDIEYTYDLDDYTTYGYVNLGELVVDGIGASEGQFAVPNEKTSQFHNMNDYNEAKSEENKAEFTELKGYTYSLRSYENGGIYFTRTLVNATENDPNYLYHLSEEAVNGADWNTVLGNNDFNVVSTETTNASTTAIYYLNDKGEHTYLYISGDRLIRKSMSEEVVIAKKGFTGRTLLYVKDNYLYSYSADTKNLYRVDYTGVADNYSLISSDEEYKDVKIPGVEFNTSWYAPEFFDNVMLYNNAQTIGGSVYNYINAVNLNGANGVKTVAELNDLNEKYDEVTEFIKGLKGDKKLSEAVQTYFYTGSTAAVDQVVEAYGEDALSENDLKEFKAYAGRKLSDRKLTSATQENNDYSTKFKDENGNYYDVASYFVGTVSSVSAEDEEAMLNGWKASVYSVVEAIQAAKAGLKWWHWVLIVIGSAAVVCGGVFLVLYLRKRSKKAMEERMRTSKPRKKIDTTDDKTIDVYADEEVAKEAEDATEEAVEVAEEVEAPAEEEVEAPVEAPAEEVVEAPAEAPAEETEKTE